MFLNSVHGFFPTCHELMTLFELLRVKLFSIDLKGNKNHFELAEGLSFCGFELPRVLQLTL